MTDTESKEVELKPCPHCGGKAKIRNNCGIHQIYCIDCQIGTEYWEEHQNQTKKRDSRIRAWNTRPQANNTEEGETKNDIAWQQGYAAGAKFGKDNSGMKEREYHYKDGYRNGYIEGFNKALEGQIKKTELSIEPIIFSQQPPKERKVSLEEIAKKLYEMHHYSRTFELNPKWEDLSENSKDVGGFRWQAKEILSLINATEEREGEE